MRKRYKQARFRQEKGSKRRARNLIMLYLPWHTEQTDLLNRYRCIREHYETQKNIIHFKEAKISIHANGINDAVNDLERNAPSPLGILGIC